MLWVSGMSTEVSMLVPTCSVIWQHTPQTLNGVCRHGCHGCLDGVPSRMMLQESIWKWWRHASGFLQQRNRVMGRDGLRFWCGWSQFWWFDLCVAEKRGRLSQPFLISIHRPLVVLWLNFYPLNLLASQTCFFSTVCMFWWGSGQDFVKTIATTLAWSFGHFRSVFWITVLLLEHPTASKTQSSADDFRLSEEFGGNPPSSLCHLLSLLLQL